MVRSPLFSASLMPIRIAEVTPRPEVRDIKRHPPTIRIRFDNVVDRDALTASIEVVGTEQPAFFRWTRGRRATVARDEYQELNPVRVGTSTETAPVSLGTHDYVDILFPQAFPASRSITVTVQHPSLERPYEWKFRTRSNSLRHPPENQRFGDSDNDVPRGSHRRAIVLGGGGAKGDFQVGAVRYLYEVDRFFPDLLVGTSIGALNAAKLAEGRTVAEHLRALQELEGIWRGLSDNGDAYRPRPAVKELLDLVGGGIDSLASFDSDPAFMSRIFMSGHIPFFGGLVAANELGDEVKEVIEKLTRLVKNALSGDYVYDLAPARALLEKHLDFDRIVRPKLGLSLSAVDLSTSRLEFFRETEIASKGKSYLINAILASAGMPVIFPPVRMNGSIYTDGGVREISGVAHAILRGATDIVVIPTSPTDDVEEPVWSEPARVHGMLRVFFRGVFDAAFAEIGQQDIKAQASRLLEYNATRGTDYRLRVIDPRLLTHSPLTFDTVAIRRAIEHGYHRARQVIAGKPLGRVPQPVEFTNTSSLLVVRPLYSDGTVIQPTGSGVQVTIAIYEGDGGIVDVDRDARPWREFGALEEPSRDNLLHVFPSKLLPGISSVQVPPSSADTVPPSGPAQHDFLRVPGRYYAFPVHGHGKYRVLVHVGRRRLAASWRNAYGDFTATQIDGVFEQNELVQWDGGTARFSRLTDNRVSLIYINGVLPPAGATVTGSDSGTVALVESFVVGPQMYGPGTVDSTWVEDTATKSAIVEFQAGPDGTMDFGIPMGIDR